MTGQASDDRPATATAFVHHPLLRPLTSPTGHAHALRTPPSLSLHLPSPSTATCPDSASPHSQSRSSQLTSLSDCSVSQSTSDTGEDDRPKRRSGKRPKYQPMILEEFSEIDLEPCRDPDMALDRLISLSTEMLAASTAALASTVTSRSSLSSLSRLEHCLDRTIRTHERNLRRRLDTLEEQKVILDGLDRDLASWPGSTTLSSSRHYQEAADLTHTIVTAERARMRAGSQTFESSLLLPDRAMIRSKSFTQDTVVSPNPIPIYALTSPIQPPRNPLRHSISVATNFFSSSSPSPNQTQTPPPNASALLNALAISQLSPSPPPPPKCIHKRSSSAFTIKHSTRSPNIRDHRPFAATDTDWVILPDENPRPVVVPKLDLVKHRSNRHLNHHHDYLAPAVALDQNDGGG